MLQYLGNEYNLEFIKQHVHIKDHKNQLSKYYTKELINLAGSIKIINYEKLCKSLNRYFKQYLDEDIVDNMEFSFIDGKYIMKYNDEELVINDIDKLNKLFPINFVWTSNLNYQ